jgi:hypothetical protein
MYALRSNPVNCGEIHVRLNNALVVITPATGKHLTCWFKKHTQIRTTHPGVLISLQLIPALQRMPQMEKQHTTETERLWDTIIVLNK